MSTRPLRIDPAARSTLVRICGLEAHDPAAQQLWKAVINALALYKPLAVLDARQASTAAQREALDRLATSVRQLRGSIDASKLHLTLFDALTGAGADLLALRATLEGLESAITNVDKQLNGRNGHGVVPNLPRRILFDALAKTFQAYSQAGDAEEYLEALRQFLTQAIALLGNPTVVPQKDHVLDFVYPPLRQRRTTP